MRVLLRLSLLSLLACELAFPAPPAIVTATALGKLPTARSGGWHVDRRGTRLATVVRAAAGLSLWCNGTSSPVYEAVGDGSPVFSVDGKSMAFAARKSGAWLVVQDGGEGRTFDGVAGLAFAKEGSTLCYAALVRGKWEVVSGGTTIGENLQGVGRLEPSPDGHHCAYPVQRGGQWLLTVDGQEGPAFDGTGMVVWSRDGRALAYGALKGKEWEVFAQGKANPTYDALGLIALSPTGEDIAFVAKKGDRYSLVRNGQVVCEGPGLLDLVYAPVGLRLAYAAEEDSKKWRVSVDGQPDPEHDSVGVWIAPVLRSTTTPEGFTMFSVEHPSRHEKPLPGSRHVTTGKDAQGVVKPSATPCLLQSQQVPLVPVEALSASSKPVEELMGDVAGHGAPVFSADGRHLAYAAWTAASEFVVVDGKQGRAYEAVGENDPVFSPDGSRLAYTASRDGKWRVVVDDAEGPGYDAIGVRNPVFSADSRHVAYAARKGDGWVLVCDSEESEPYDGIVANGPCFLDDDALECLAWRDGVLYRLRRAGP